MDPRRSQFWYTASVKVADLFTLSAIWRLSTYLHTEPVFSFATNNVLTSPFPSFDLEAHRYRKLGWLLLLVFSGVFHIVGAYRRDRLGIRFRALKKMTEGTLLAHLCFVALCFYLHAFFVSRFVLVLFPLLSLVALMAERGICDALYLWFQTQWVRRKRTLIVGEGDLLSLYLAHTMANKRSGVEYVGWLSVSQDQHRHALEGVAHWGDAHELSHDFLVRNQIERVLLALPNAHNAQLERLLTILSNELVATLVLPDFGRYATFGYSATDESGFPLLLFNTSGGAISDMVLKRLFDIVLSVSALVVLSPLLLVLGWIIRRTSPGPALYSQWRVSLDGRRFQIYKFRSMRLDAEAHSGPRFASPTDNRTTPIGAWLRRLNLDELPQLYNVLRGDMSLVGPRPERPVFVEQFCHEIPKYMLRHHVPCGLTGWAQINGFRGQTSIEDRLKYDLYYISHWSLWFDLKIIVLTVLRGFQNAY